MRSARFAILFAFYAFAIPVWAQQTANSDQASPPQPTSDAQAVAVVQAAITALGGAPTIAKAQNWTFQAQLLGPRLNGSVEYAMSTDTDTGKLVRLDGTSRPAPPLHSHFVPALVSSILLNESQDPNFTVHYAGPSTVDSKAATAINFMCGPVGIPAQIWYFDANNLPIRVDFRLPAEIGARESFPGMIALSDYRSVGGVMYPFRIVSIVLGNPPVIVILQSVAPGATAVPNQFNGPAGDLR